MSDKLKNTKLCDFGLSVVNSKIKRMKNQQIGDVAYNAPEVLRGEEYKNASDVYSFGMILWLA